MRKLVLLAEKMGADEAEACRLSGQVLSVSQDGESNTREFSASEGYAIRVLKGGRVGFSYFAEGESAKDAIKNALVLSKFARQSPFHFPSSEKCQRVETFDKMVDALTEEEIRGMLARLISGAKKPAKPTKTGVDCSSSELVIENSSGLSLSKKSTSVSCFMHCALGKSSGSSFRSSRKLDFSPMDVGREASVRAIESSKAKPLKTGVMPAVFEPEALSSLVYSLLLPSLQGERAYRKISALHDKLNQELGSRLLSIYDDPLAEGTGSAPFDGEGVPSRRKPLIEKGVLRNFLFDLKTASLTGDSLNPSPGNCARGSYLSEPGASSSNIVVGNGNCSDALAECKKGILVCSVFGEHTANPLTGEFSVSVDRGFEISDGVKGKPVRGNVISGNVFDLLKKITAVEKKSERQGSFISPNVAFDGIQVVGK